MMATSVGRDSFRRLFLIAGESVQALAAIHELVEEFDEIIVCSTARFGYGTHSVFTSRSEVYDDEDALLRMLRKCASKHESWLLPMVDEAAFFIARNESELQSLGFSFLNPRLEDLTRFTDKYELANLLEAEGLSNLMTRSLSINDADDVQYPRIAKPKQGAGARGFVILHSEKDYNKFVKELTDDKNTYFSQRYLSVSRQFKVTGAVINGRVLASAALEKKRYFPINAGSSTLCVEVKPDEYNASLLRTFAKLAALTSWTGIMDLDVIADVELKNSHILEINPRLPACNAHYFKNGLKFLSLLIAQQEPSILPEKFVSTQYIGLDLMRGVSGGVAALWVCLRDILNPNISTYELFPNDVRGAIVGFMGQVLRMRSNLRAKRKNP